MRMTRAVLLVLILAGFGALASLDELNDCEGLCISCSLSRTEFTVGEKLPPPKVTIRNNTDKDIELIGPTITVIGCNLIQPDKTEIPMCIAMPTGLDPKKMPTRKLEARAKVDFTPEGIWYYKNEEGYEPYVFSEEGIYEIFCVYDDLTSNQIKLVVIKTPEAEVDMSMGENSRFDNNIAFLKEGEVWITDSRGLEKEKITETDGKIESFLFSPGLNFLAYSKILEWVEEPGLWEEEEAPQKAVCSIVIANADTQEMAKEIMPPDDSWIYPAKWISDSTLLFYASSGFDVWGFFKHDLQQNKQIEIDYSEGSRLLGADFNREGALMLYIDDSGIGKEYHQNLHIVNLETKTDKILTSRRSILEPRISCDSKNVAFIEVENVNGEFFDNLWYFNIKDLSLKKLYRGKAKPKSAGVSELSWSFDGRYVGMFFSPEALIVDVVNQNNIHKIGGIDFHWIANNEVICAQGNNVYRYNLNSRKRELFLPDATKPIFLQRRMRKAHRTNEDF